MRMVCLNIRAGGGRRIGAVAEYLEAQNPHTVVLTEWRNGPAGVAVEAWAQGRGMHMARTTDGGTANGVFVASLAPFAVESLRPNVPGAGVLMLARFRQLRLLACYFPIQRSKAPFFARCAELAGQESRRPFLLLGDLNTGNQIKDRDPRGVRYHCAEDFDALTGAAGLTDLWRRNHGDAAREWTWVSHRNNGFRLDHALANRRFLAAADPSCRYDHAPRGAFTDHSAIVLDCGGGGDAFLSRLF